MNDKPPPPDPDIWNIVNIKKSKRTFSNVFGGVPRYEQLFEDLHFQTLERLKDIKTSLNTYIPPLKHLVRPQNPRRNRGFLQCLDLSLNPPTGQPKPLTVISSKTSASLSMIGAL